MFGEQVVWRDRVNGIDKSLADDGGVKRHEKFRVLNLKIPVPLEEGQLILQYPSVGICQSLS